LQAPTQSSRDEDEDILLVTQPINIAQLISLKLYGQPPNFLHKDSFKHESVTLQPFLPANFPLGVVHRKWIKDYFFRNGFVCQKMNQGGIFLFHTKQDAYGARSHFKLQYLPFNSSIVGSNFVKVRLPSSNQSAFEALTLPHHVLQSRSFINFKQDIHRKNLGLLRQCHLRFLTLKSKSADLFWKKSAGVGGITIADEPHDTTTQHASCECHKQTSKSFSCGQLVHLQDDKQRRAIGLYEIALKETMMLSCTKYTTGMEKCQRRMEKGEGESRPRPRPQPQPPYSCERAIFSPEIHGIFESASTKIIQRLERELQTRLVQLKDRKCPVTFNGTGKRSFNVACLTRVELFYVTARLRELHGRFSLEHPPTTFSFSSAMTDTIEIALKKADQNLYKLPNQVLDIYWPIFDASVQERQNLYRYLFSYHFERAITITRHGMLFAAGIKQDSFTKEMIYLLEAIRQNISIKQL